MATGKSWLDAGKLTDEQRSNVATIIAVGKEVGASPRDITIALMVAAQESEFRNINYGDEAGPDSRGLFQQRTWWGPLAERMDPAGAARLFYLGGRDGSRGLLDIKDRDSLSLTRAGQAVQRSAYPDAYAKHQQLAETLLGAPADSGAPLVAPARPAMDDPDLDVPSAAGTVTINPTQDNTATTLADLEREQARARVEAAGYGHGGIVPGMGAVTALDSGLAPGMGAVGAPGTEAVNAPGAAATSPQPGTVATGLAADTAPAAPQVPTVMSRQEFDALYPDAAATSRFTAPMNGTGGAALRGQVVSTALSYLGTPYAWGGNDYDGIDCSGLVQQVARTYGVELPRLSADQARSGTRVGWDALKPGDLAAIDNSDRNNGADHIAIWLGGGYILEAPRPGLAVRRRKLSEAEMTGGWYGVHLAQLD